jgi:guanylate kinase
MTHEDFVKALPELVYGYQPAPAVIEHIGRVTLLMLVGPSGVGKSTLIKHSGLHFVPSDTTRMPRPGEKDGVDMNFRTDYDQLAADIKAGNFVQIAPFATGELYATKYSSYPESGAAVMPVMAEAVPLFRKLGFEKTISAFVVPPSYQEWMRRMSEQQMTVEQRAKRLSEAKISFEFGLSDQQTHFILCDDINESAGQVKDLLNGQSNEVLEAEARAVAQSLLTSLE